MRLRRPFALLLVAIFAWSGVAQSRASTAKLPHTISKDEIFQMFVPDYESRRKKAAAHQDDPAYSPFRIDVSESRETDFGISGEHYLLVAVQALQGSCGSCYQTYFGIIDLESRKLVWSLENVGLHGAPGLRIFKLPGGEPVFSLRRVEGSQGCCSSTTEDWYQPRLRKDGLACARIWSGLVLWQNRGNRGGNEEVGCGRMALAPGGRFVYSTVTAASFGAESVPGNPEESLDSACSKSNPDLGGDVHFLTTERWESTDSGLKRTEREVRRKDRTSSDVFPFDLDVRNPPDYLTEPAGSVDSGAPFSSEVVSPDGRYQVEPTRKWGWGQELRLVSRIDFGTVRAIKVSDGDRFEGEVMAVGWMGDSSRFFVVVRFGYLGHQVLLSFPVGAGEELWERLLADDAAKYSDGFVLMPRWGEASRRKR